MRKAKAIDSKLAIAKESATVIYVLAETQKQAEEWKTFKVEKGEGFKYALIGGCRRGEAVGRLRKQASILCDWLKRILLSLTDPKLEEAVSY